jgi:hypothetical protein
MKFNKRVEFRCFVAYFDDVVDDDNDNTNNNFLLLLGLIFKDFICYS